MTMETNNSNKTSDKNKKVDVKALEIYKDKKDKALKTHQIITKNEKDNN